MTRVNLVHVTDLADQHLFAEWREIKMVVPAAKKSLTTQSVAEVVGKIPSEYTLGAGHVTFFYNKLPFLKDRFALLTNELLQRGFDIKPFDFETPDYSCVWLRLTQTQWKPTKKDIQTNVDRIAQRLNERPDWYRYYGDVYAPDFFIDRYQQQLLVDTITA